MKTIVKILKSIVMVPFWVVLGLLFGLIALVLKPIDLVRILLDDIWARKD